MKKFVQLRRQVWRLLTLALAVFSCSALSAQNGQFDVRFSVKNFDCANSKVTIQLQVRSHDAAHTFLMGDANYRFDYDPTVINTPKIAVQETFSSVAPSSDFDYGVQNLNGSTAGATAATVSLNTFYQGSADSAKLVGPNWTNVSCITFNMVNPTGCINLNWHTDTQFPVTGMNEIIITDPTPATFSYNQFNVAAGGYFGNFSMCIPVVCSPMLAQGDINTTLKNTPVGGNVATNDIGSGLTVTTTPLSGPSNGTITLAPNGTYTYTPNPNFVGKDTIKYKVCNAANICDSASLVITTLDVPTVGPGKKPVAQPDAAITYVNTPISDNVRNNDLNPNPGDSLIVSATPVSPVKNGTVTLKPDGSYTYTPNNGFVGQDTFKYKVCDSATPTLCDTTSVIIKVIAPNNGTNPNPPLATDDAVFTVVNAPVSGNMSTNDVDPNGNALVYTTTPVTNPSHGSVVINPNGTFTYTPANNYFGPDQYVYQVCDATYTTLCAKATVYITIAKSANLPPVATVAPIVLPQDSMITVCQNVTDPNPLDTIASVTLCAGFPMHGTATTKVNNGTTPHMVCITYTPTAGYFGPDTVCVNVCDNGLPQMCATAKVPVTVNHVNHAPIAVIPPTTVPENSGPTAVCANITDVDTADAHTSTPCATAANHGVVTTTVDNSVQPHKICVTYTPALNYFGPDTACVILCDNGSPSKCDTIKTPITVTHINQPPVATLPTTTVNENGGPTTVCTTITDPDTGDNHTSAPCATAAAHGTVTTTVDNSVTPHKLCMIYTPALNYFGPDTACVILCDNGSPSKCDTIKTPITVIHINQPPVVAVPPTTVPEDSTITVCANITDPDLSDKHTVTPCATAHGTVTATADNTVTPHKLCVTYAPSLHYYGPDTACVIVCDNGSPSKCDTVKIPVTIIHVNQPPVVPNMTFNIPQDSAKNVCLPVTDLDAGDTHTVMICGLPKHGTLWPPTVDNTSTPHSLCFTYTPTALYQGKDSVCLLVCDNGTPSKCDSVKTIFVVNPINHKPIAQNDINNTNKNTPVSGTVITNDTDVDPGQTLTLNPTPVTNPTNGTIVLNPNGSYTYTPNAGFIGDDSLKYQVCDNGTPTLCDTATLSIKVRDNNPGGGSHAAPIANNDNTSTLQNTPVVINVTGNDVPGTGLTLNKPTLVPGTSTNGTPVLNPDGTVTFTPTPGFVGKGTFKYSVCDNGTPSLCDTATVTVNVTAPIVGATNHPPVPLDDAVTTLVNTPVSGNVSTNDSDPDAGQTLTYSLVPGANTVNGNLTLNNDGTFTYTPNANYIGPDKFKYQVCDNGNPVMCATAWAYITVLQNPCASISLKVFLEGPFNTATGKMSTTLNQRGLLPGQTPIGTYAVKTPVGQPYKGAPWNFTMAGDTVSAYPSDVTDWVLVSIRTDSINASSAIFKQAALLHSDGTVTFLSPCFALSPTGKYFLVVEHRNHVGVMTPKAIPVVGGVMTYDFTKTDGYALTNPPSFGQKQKGSVWTMYAADGAKATATTNYDISFPDSQLWKSMSGIFDQYQAADYNLDADVNFQDQVLWKTNSGKYSGVPH